MMNKLIKKRDYIAKDLFTPKYRMRVVKSKKAYNRQEEKRRGYREYSQEF